jgi:site-specific DNA-cytosine methylase
MTKHFSPERVDAYADYIRFDDGATMRWNGDSFVRFPRLSAKEVEEEAKQTAAEEDIKPALSDNKPLDDVKETPEDISERFIRAEMAKHFDKQETEDKEDDPAEDGPVFDEDGKRYRRYNPEPSKRQAYYPRPTSERGAVVFEMHEQRIVVRPVGRASVEIDTFTIWVGDKVFDISLKPYTTGMPISRWREEGMTALLDSVFESHPDVVETCEAAASRARQESYGITAPKNDSDVLPRKSRNKSPSEPWRILVWAEYFRLNGSLEPLQTIFGKSDGILADFPSDADGEGGEQPEAKYPLVEYSHEVRTFSQFVNTLISILRVAA